MKYLLLPFAILFLSGCLHGESVKTYVFSNPSQCENSRSLDHFNVIVECNALGQYAQEIHSKIDFHLLDGSLCATLYSVNACQRDQLGRWYPLPSGFMVYQNNEYAPVPLYYSDYLGRLLTPSGYPINLGVNEIRVESADILRLSRYRPLYQHICFYYDEESQKEMAFNMVSDNYYPKYLLLRNDACEGVLYQPESYTQDRIINNLWL